MSDVMAVRRAIASWAQLYDLGRDGEWIDGLLDDDVVLREPGDLTITGKAAVRELIEQPWEGTQRGVHILGEPVVDVDGDSATAVTSSMYVMPAGGAYQIFLVGRYEDVLRRSDDGSWRFVSRTSHHLGSPATAPVDDRIDVGQVCGRMLWCIDRQSWDDLPPLLADKVMIDYTTILGGDPQHVTPDEAIANWKLGRSHLGSAQHLLGQPHVVVTGSEATCEVNFQATCNNSRDGGVWRQGGYYTFRVVHAGDGWRIAGVTLTVLWESGDATIVQLAVAAVSAE